MKDKIRRGDLIDMVNGLSGEDKKFVINFIKEKSKTTYHYRHSFWLTEKLTEYNNSFFDGIENSTTRIAKKETHLNNHHSDFVYYSDSEIIDDKIREEAQEFLLKKINNNLKELEEEKEDIVDTINEQKKNIKIVFKKHLRKKKLQKIEHGYK